MCLSAFIVFLLCATAFDLWSWKIPNSLIIAALAGAMFCALVFQGWQGVAQAVAGFAIGLGLMLPGWLLRFTGGGDVKLFAVVGAYLGNSLILHAFVLSILTGAFVAVLLGGWSWLSGQAASPLPRYKRMLIELLATGRVHYIRPQPNEVGGQRFPFVPSITIGSLLAYSGLLGSQWL